MSDYSRITRFCRPFSRLGGPLTYDEWKDPSREDDVVDDDRDHEECAFCHKRARLHLTVQWGVETWVCDDHREKEDAAEGQAKLMKGLVG